MRKLKLFLKAWYEGAMAQLECGGAAIAMRWLGELWTANAFFWYLDCNECFSLVLQSCHAIAAALAADESAEDLLRGSAQDHLNAYGEHSWDFNAELWGLGEFLCREKAT
eukprot:7380524-Prymnesium_polylepis.1